MFSHFKMVLTEQCSIIDKKPTQQCSLIRTYTANVHLPGWNLRNSSTASIDVAWSRAVSADLRCTCAPHSFDTFSISSWSVDTHILSKTERIHSRYTRWLVLFIFQFVLNAMKCTMAHWLDSQI